MNPQFISTTPDPNPNPTRVRTYTVKFFSHRNDTVVTSTPAIAREWVYSLRHNHRRALHTSSLTIGLGVQWSPTFSHNSDTAATLQLCVGTDCLIFQLFHASAVPATLRRLLSDERVTFVGVHNRRDRKLLEESEHKLEAECLVDLAREYGYGNRSMEEMAATLLGADEVVKPHWLGVSDWEAFWLSDEQVQYACVDAHVSYCLAQSLQDDEGDDVMSCDDGYGTEGSDYY